MEFWYALAAQVGGAIIVALVLILLAISLVSVSRRTAFARTQHALTLERLRTDIASARERRGVEAARAQTWNGFRKFTVVRKVPEGGEICSVYLKPHDGKPMAAFAPGQFLTLRVRIPGQPKATTRCYSLSCSPAQAEHYRVTVKRARPVPYSPGAPDGLMSSYLHEVVQEGAILDLKAPSGNFVLDIASRRPVVLVAGGVGLTPLLSMIETVVDQGFPRDVWLFYGVANSSEQIFKSYLERLACEQDRFHLHVCYSRTRPGDVAGADYQHAHRPSIELLRRWLPSSNFEFYVCGPPPLMEAIVTGLEEWGVPDQDVHFEAFGPASVKRAPPAVGLDEPGHKVHFQKSGRTLVWTPGSGSLLDCAEANGMSIDAGCRAGNCGTCLTALQSGTVSYLSQPGEPPDPGSCLICVGVPRTEVVLDA